MQSKRKRHDALSLVGVVTAAILGFTMSGLGAAAPFAATQSPAPIRASSAVLHGLAHSGSLNETEPW